MRNIVMTFTLLLLAAGLRAQPYTTTWPYLYSDFQDGVIYLTGGQKIYHKLNVHLQKGRLHYIDNGVVKEARAGDIFYVEIGPGPEKFMVVNGDIMRVEAESHDGFVADHITGDLEALMVGTGAYGMQANTEAIQSYSSLNLQQGVNTNHMLLLQEKDNGQEFDLKEEYFIVTRSKVWRAVRSDIMKALPTEDRAAFKAFVKQNKIKWKDPRSLIRLTDFLKDK